MLNLLAWIVLIFKDVWWTRPEIVADDYFKKKPQSSRRTKKTIPIDSNDGGNEVIKVEIMEEMQMEEDKFRRLNSYTESFGSVDDSEYLPKKAYIVQRNDSTEVMYHEAPNGRFIPEHEPNEKYEQILSDSANVTERELDEPRERTKVRISVNKRLKKTSNNVPTFTPQAPQPRDYEVKIDLKVKSTGKMEAKDPETQTDMANPELKRLDSWDLLDIQKKDGHENQNRNDQSTFYAGKSPEISKIGDQQHSLHIKCESPKSEFQDFDIIMRKRKRHTDAMQKAAEAFGNLGHREEKIFGNSPRQAMSARWEKLETATKTKTYKGSEK